MCMCMHMWRGKNEQVHKISHITFHFIPTLKVELFIIKIQTKEMEKKYLTY